MQFNLQRVQEEKTTVKFDYAAAAAIRNKLDVDTKVKLTVNSHSMLVDSLRHEFERDGVVFPDAGIWKGEMFTDENALATPPPTKKARTSPPESGSDGIRIMGSAQSAQMSEALRRRVADKAGWPASSARPSAPAG